MEYLRKSVVLLAKTNNSNRLVNVLNKNTGFIRTCSNAQKPMYPNPNLFINPQVQELLIRITRIDLNTVYRPVQKKISAPEYQFHTDEELQELMEEAKEKVVEKLQMPPILNPREPIDEVLSKDPEMQGYTKSKVIAIDVTPGLKETDRHIVVREPNGILRKANWVERDTMLKIYFPIEGREIVIPRMFQDEYLQNILHRGWYKFVLDKACNQFEPDDLQYVNVTQIVYAFVNEKRHFNSLRSTRHFGPMAFYLASRNNIDNLLLDVIQSEFLEEAVDLVRLHHKIHPETDSAKSADDQKDNLDFVMDFIKKDSKKKDYLELALQTLKELHEQRKAVEDGIQKAHGH